VNLVFASGFLVPQRVRLLGINYFRKLEKHIENGGRHNAIFPYVAPLGSCQERAEALAEKIQRKFPSGDIHIIAHSMGGLDSRVLIANDLHGLSGRIKSLTTIATPHAGSPVADLLLGTWPGEGRLGKAIAGVIKFLGLDKGALPDLSTDGAKIIPDPQTSHPDILYRSYAAVGRPGGLLSFLGLPRKKTCVFLMPTHRCIVKVTGEENDGLVPFSSAQYGKFQKDALWECDHADAVGWNLDFPWWSKFDHLAHYDAIITDLEKLFTA
jgi:triacylglycerol lipase